MNFFIDAFRKYATFDGRATRQQFWMFYLFYIIFSFLAGFVDGLAGLTNNRTGYGPIGTLYLLVTLVPYIALFVRRMHDTGRPGWWVIIPIANLIFACTDGTPGPNQYGPDPKGRGGYAPAYGAPGYPPATPGYGPAGYGQPGYGQPSPQQPVYGQPPAEQYSYSPPTPPATAPTPAPTAAPAGWLPDPVGRHEFRYWDGMQWTANVSDAGAVSVDPLQ